MSDVTQILSAIEQGDPSAAEELLPLRHSDLVKPRDPERLHRGKGSVPKSQVGLGRTLSTQSSRGTG